ncbi:aldo/keto reductase [Fodinibius sediminis]|uniref:Predicted oxidoreductase n=1 Tax=Fodinibius sediminis TaxID=1214077 RepID=A0A521ELT1_9BACT|nr:aldo/keto reductase [Fodinibius sediminis]SMO84864.1 Predicted oxidoreductase [Fodinibius sediminis]
MNYRKFGDTDLEVSEVGFGTWGIGGPAMAQDVPIGWGEVDDDTSIKALRKAYECGVNFYDTADFYGLGHSEELLGKVFGNKKDVIIASKVGHRLDENDAIYVDYSKEYILRSCEKSLKRLNRETIDFYQLHTAKRDDLEKGECIEAMEMLKEQGKIRYWGVSLNTYNPGPEAEYLLTNDIGNGLQVVLNILNQRSLKIIEQAAAKGMGIIARMPLQFGLLTGKFDKNTRFDENDHRHFRLKPAILESSLDALEEVWPLTKKYNITKTELSLSFILSFDGVSTVIPGIKTPRQAEQNTRGIVKLSEEDRDLILSLFKKKFDRLVDQMQHSES